MIAARSSGRASISSPETTPPLESPARHVVAAADDRDLDLLPACERHGVLQRFFVERTDDAERGRFDRTVKLDGLELGLRSASSAEQRGGGLGAELLP